MKSLIGSLIGLMLSVCTASGTEQHYSPQELEAAKAETARAQSVVDVRGGSRTRP